MRLKKEFCPPPPPPKEQKTNKNNPDREKNKHLGFVFCYLGHRSLGHGDAVPICWGWSTGSPLPSHTARWSPGVEQMVPKLTGCTQLRRAPGVVSCLQCTERESPPPAKRVRCLPPRFRSFLRVLSGSSQSRRWRRLSSGSKA